MKAALFTLFIGMFFILGIYNSALAIDENELNVKLENMAIQRGITDKAEIEKLKLQVLSILKTRERFTYLDLKEPCKKDIKSYCPDKTDISNTLECIKENRDDVSNLCENALRNAYGSRPIKEAQLYNGVKIPAGSTFFYDPQGNVLGVIASENFKYKNIYFKKGQIRFHPEGISVGHLVSDQYIDSIKYKAGGIGPFFNKKGYVTNATLAENTEIEGIVYKRDTQIEFHRKGKVKHGTVANNVTVQDEVYLSGSIIWFEKNGEIRKF